MAHIIDDRVLESSTTTGTGAFTLAGAILGYRRFSAVCSVADTAWYYIEGIDSLNRPSGEYEYGLGTYSGVNTLTRTTVRGSSNGGSAVNFSSGTKLVGIGAQAVKGSAIGEWLKALGQSRYSVLAYGAYLNGSTDDSTAFNAAVTAAAAAGGGTITAPPGSTIRLEAAVTVTASNIQFDLPNCSVAFAGSADFAGFDFGSTSGFIAAPVLSVNAAKGAMSITVSTLGGLAAGSWLRMTKDAPDNGGAARTYNFHTKVRSVSGAGPWTINLTTALPVAFNTADAGLLLARISMLDNCGIHGPVRFDGSSATGTTVHGVKALYLTNSRFDGGLKFTDFDAGAGFWAEYGHGNAFDDMQAEGSGTASFDALFFVDQTHAKFGVMRTLNGTGFGVQYASCIYSVGLGSISEGSRSGRGVKWASCLESDFYGTQGHGSDYNGAGITIGTQYCRFFGIGANGNLSTEGLWLSDQYNLYNQFFGVDCAANATRDIFVGTTDTENTFFGVRTSGTFYVSNATTLIYGWNGKALCGGAAANSPITLIDNSARTIPMTDGGMDLGSSTAKWNYLYANRLRLVFLATTTHYANDAAAGAGGLVQGEAYTTSAGALMVKL